MRINPPAPRIDVEPEGPLPGRPLDFLDAIVRLDPVRGGFSAAPTVPGHRGDAGAVVTGAPAAGPW